MPDGSFSHSVASTQERFRTITSSYYRGAHGIIIVYDVTDKELVLPASLYSQELRLAAAPACDCQLVNFVKLAVWLWPQGIPILIIYEPCSELRTPTSRPKCMGTTRISAFGLSALAEMCRREDDPAELAVVRPECSATIPKRGTPGACAGIGLNNDNLPSTSTSICVRHQ